MQILIRIVELKSFSNEKQLYAGPCPEVYWELCQTYKIERFAKMVNGLNH